jgi:acylphosphatase
MTERVKSVRVVVRGRVQGVFFRATTAQRAVELGVRGWVRNRPDGSVEAHCEGPEAAVDTLVAWCEIGPSRSRVDSVVSENAADERANGFEVRS